MGRDSPFGPVTRDLIQAQAAWSQPTAENSLHVPGTPLSSCSPRSTNLIPDPTTRSATVRETRTSPDAALETIRAPMWTASPPMSSPRSSISPAWTPERAGTATLDETDRAIRCHRKRESARPARFRSPGRPESAARDSSTERNVPNRVDAGQRRLRFRGVNADGFLAAVDSARPLVAMPEVAAAWEHPSSLAGLTVGALTAHLVQAVATVDDRLDRDIAEGVEPIDAVGYYLGTLHGKQTSASVRDTTALGDTERAAPGHAALVAHLDEARKRLGSRLPVEPPERLVRVAGGRNMRLDEYLATRVLAVVVHADDLAVSVRQPSPTFPDQCGDAIASLLVGMSRRRHGDTAVIRAFTRHERDTVEALRVF